MGLKERFVLYSTRDRIAARLYHMYSDGELGVRGEYDPSTEGELDTVMGRFEEKKVEEWLVQRCYAEADSILSDIEKRP